MISSTAFPLLEELQGELEKDLIAFHKSQKTGYYSFDPYFEDFYENLMDFTFIIEEKYEYVSGSGKAGVPQALTNGSSKHCMKQGYIPFAIRISVSKEGNTVSASLYYTFYPDCIVYNNEDPNRRAFIYRKEQRNGQN